MADHFLLYWKPATADEVLAAGGPLRYAASNQFDRVKAGDVVWPVTCRNGELRLLGRVAVARVVGRGEAEEALGREGLWDADWYALAEGGTGTAREVSLRAVAEGLRFDSPGGKNRLALEEGSVSPKQLQAMRKLTATSVAVLEAAWEARGVAGL